MVSGRGTAPALARVPGNGTTELRGFCMRYAPVTACLPGTPAFPRAGHGYQPIAKLARIIRGSSVTLNFSLNKS